MASSPQNDKPLQYRAGQFAWLSLAPRLLPLFDHPFSLAPAPAAGPEISFIIKEVGDFTERVGSVAVGTAVGVDGPHGSFTLPAPGHGSVLLVAGGAGIAPIMGILRDLAATRDQRSMRLI